MDIDPIGGGRDVRGSSSEFVIGGTAMMYWYGHDMGWWGYVGMAILTAVFWVLVLGSLVALVKYVTDRQHTQRETRYEQASAADVLASRFARGEIDEAEYRDRAAVLREAGRG
jgi:putative membrane protein